MDEYFKEWLRVIDKNNLINMVPILSNLYKHHSVEPDYKNIFKVFNITPYNKLRIVFLGQDPYPQHKISTGIAFGNVKNVKSLSPSLELLKNTVINFDNYHNYITFDETLESWCKQGILMLNSALTVETNKPDSHKDLWFKFTASLLYRVSRDNQGLIYVLLGNRAKEFKKYIAFPAVIIECKHPSYYCRNNILMPNIFKDIDKYLKYYWDESIEWYKEIK